MLRIDKESAKKSSRNWVSRFERPTQFRELGQAQEFSRRGDAKFCALLQGSPLCPNR